MPAAQLAELAETVVVTLAAEGAIAYSGGKIVTVRRASPSSAPLDTTGAGDLLVAAYIWADLRGAEPADRLRLGGAVREPRRDDADRRSAARSREAELMRAGAALDLTAPPLAGAARSDGGRRLPQGCAPSPLPSPS